jgi:hypothetical protein
VPRFVVQHHVLAADDDHWDLMLEAGPVLWTWRLADPPDRADRLPASAQHLGDHRIEYLQYEGEVSGGRGTVAIHDRGSYRWLAETPQQPFDLIDSLEFVLDGQRARGSFRLQRTPEDGKDLWRLRRLK